jgi:hypothetical protein
VPAEADGPGRIRYNVPVSATGSRRSALALIVGGLIWTVSWFMVALADDGTALGLGEGEWRALLNPALVLIAGGAWAFYVRFGGFAAGLGLLGTATVIGALAVMLAANVVEVGLWGEGWSDAAWRVFVPAGLVCVVGLLALGVAIVRTGVVPKQSSLVFAGGLAAFVAGAFAIPLFGIGWLLWGYVLLGAPPLVPRPDEFEQP